MSNLTDALIAAKLVGGSGGSGGGSGLPEITTETVTTLDDDIVIEEGECIAEVTQALAGGESVTVSWDGTSYSCVATKISLGDMTAVAFGNLSIIKMGADTGEPFVFIQMETGGMVEYEIVSSVSDGTYHVTVSAAAQSPADGSILIVENGVWGTQSGYAYQKNGDLMPIDGTLLAEAHFSMTDDGDLRCDKSIDYIAQSVPLRASVGSSMLGSVEYDNDGKLVLSVISGNMISLYGYDDQLQLWVRKTRTALTGAPVVVSATVGTFTNGSASITLNSADIDKLASAIDSGGVGYINCENSSAIPYLRVERSDTILHALGYNFEGTGTSARYIKFYMISRLSTNTTIYQGKVTIAQ